MDKQKTHEPQEGSSQASSCLEKERKKKNNNKTPWTSESSLKQVSLSSFYFIFYFFPPLGSLSSLLSTAIQSSQKRRNQQQNPDKQTKKVQRVWEAPRWASLPACLIACPCGTTLYSPRNPSVRVTFSPFIPLLFFLLRSVRLWPKRFETSTLDPTGLINKMLGTLWNCWGSRLAEWELNEWLEWMDSERKGTVG